MNSCLKPKGKSRYVPLADQLTRQILPGVLRPGGQLPSARRKSYPPVPSRRTVLQGYDHQVGQGLAKVLPQSAYCGRAARQVFSLNLSSVLAPRRLTKQTDQLEDLIAEGGRQDGPQPARLFCVPGIMPGLASVLKLTKALKAAAQKVPFGGVRDGNVAGDGLPRRQVAGHALQWSSQPRTAHGLVTAEGRSPAWDCCRRVITRPGATGLIERAACFTLLHPVVSLGLKLPTNSNTGPELPTLVAHPAQDHAQVCLFTPGFGNPLGSRLPEAHKDALGRLLAGYDVSLIVADVNWETYFDRERPRKACDRQGRGRRGSAVSKTWDPGYRVGGVAPE